MYEDHVIDYQNVAQEFFVKFCELWLNAADLTLIKEHFGNSNDIPNHTYFILFDTDRQHSPASSSSLSDTDSGAGNSTPWSTGSSVG